MMGVYIKGMEMPTSCFSCPFREKVNPDDYVCMALNKEFEETFSLSVGKRHKDCPICQIGILNCGRGSNIKYLPMGLRKMALLC